MWAVIKKILNSTLGKSYSLALDELDMQGAYSLYCDLISYINGEDYKLKKIDKNHTISWDDTFVPYGAEEVDTEGSITNQKYVAFIPNTVKKIQNSAFSNYYCTIIIDNKYGVIEGHPWGHPYPERILYLRDRI